MTQLTPPPQKFMFGLAFDSEDGMTAQERARLAPTFTQEQLDDARATGFAEGQAAGIKSVEAEEQRRANVLLDRIALHIEGLHKQAADEWRKQQGQMQTIAVAIARKILPTYIAQNGADEIETILRRIVAEMSHEPRLVVRIAEARFDEMNDKINAIAADRAFAGKVVVMADASMGESDCRVEWADGGVERDVSALWDEIDNVMREVQTDESAPAASPTSDSGETK